MKFYVFCKNDSCANNIANAYKVMTDDKLVCKIMHELIKIKDLYKIMELNIGLLYQ